MQFDDDWISGREFNWKAGYALASACQLSYSDNETIARILSEVWKQSATVFSIGRTQGFVAEGAHSVVVAFRGTQGFGDWTDNAQLVPRHLDAFHGDVHSGFAEAYDAVADHLAGVLRDVGGKSIWFTGHSLGGALALIGVATHLNLDPAGVVTFGQPRMLDRDAAGFVAETFGSSYVRVVNDDDIVARIPPFYRHTGRLIHFDFSGELMAESIAEATDGIESGPAPMNESDFEALRQQIDDLRAAPDTEAFEFEGLEGPSVESMDVAVEGLFPGVQSHRINNYVNLMRKRAMSTTETEVSEVLDSLRHRSDLIDQSTRELVVEAPTFESLDAVEMESVSEAPILMTGIGGVDSSSHTPRQPVLLKLLPGNWTPPEGMKLHSRIGNFATAMASEEEILAMKADPVVASIEPSRDAGIEDLDTSLPFVGATDVHRPPIGELGDRAIVGIIDTGVDILHDTFKDSSGATRILAIWDQRDGTGLTPHAVDPDAFSQDYGTLYLASQIDGFISDHAAGQPSHSSRLRDPHGHGTHVAAIAAGRAVGQLSDGMAPDAKIVCVVASISQDPGEPPSIGYSNSHVDGLSFLRSASHGGNVISTDRLPMAVNVSLGMNAGAHDGSTTLEAAFDAVTGMGRDPGFVIVKSAGNERGHAGHARQAVFQDGILPLTWSSSSDFRNQDYFEAWFDGLDDVAFRLIDPGGNASAEVSFDAPQETVNLGGNRCRLHLTKTHPDNGNHRLTVSVEPAPNNIQAGTWTLEMRGRQILSPQGEVHIWVERTRIRPVTFGTQDPQMTLSIPGTARTVVSVGACNSSVPIRLNPSSSWGLTRDGRLKPELSAPGFRILSARSNSSDLTAGVSLSGTSMAAPHVTGAIALVHSRREKQGKVPLNAVQLQANLKRTIRGLPKNHHVGIGYGVLDAKKAFDEMT